MAGIEKINKMLADVEKQHGCGLVQTMDVVLAELESLHLAWVQRIRPMPVGVDPSNRDGLGVNAEDVHTLGSAIISLGWSWQQVGSAVCIEEAPDSSLIVDFNKSLGHGCDLLPNGSALESIRYGSVACSHTNMFLRCLASACVSPGKSEAAEDGRLSLDLVGRRDAELARAAKDGLEWKVLSSKVRHLCPSLLSLMQRARNAPQAVAKAEHEMQVMLRMHCMASAQQRLNSCVDSESIRRNVAMGMPACAVDLPELSVFIAVCGGGTDGDFLQDLAHFHRRFVDSRKVCIRGQFLQAVADMGLEIPYLKIAIVKAQYSAPANKVNRYNEPCFILASDLSKLVRTKK